MYFGYEDYVVLPKLSESQLISLSAIIPFPFPRTFSEWISLCDLVIAKHGKKGYRYVDNDFDRLMGFVLNRKDISNLNWMDVFYFYNFNPWYEPDVYQDDKNYEYNIKPKDEDYFPTYS